jgi:cell division initiation protein
VRENAQLRREAERLARELDAYRSREKTIQDTLTTAQTVVEQLKRTAIKESESIVIDAELRAEKLLSEAREQRATLANEIREQRHMRQRLEADLRRTLESYGKLIEAFAPTDRPEE